MNLSTLLKLFGFDLKKPLDALLKLLKTIGKDKLQKELGEAFQKKMTPARRQIVVAGLREVAAKLESGKNAEAAEKAAELLLTVKF